MVGQIWTIIRTQKLIGILQIFGLPKRQEVAPVKIQDVKLSRDTFGKRGMNALEEDNIQKNTIHLNAQKLNH